MLAKAIEKIESLVNAKENCHVEEKMIFGEKYIHQGEELYRYKTADIQCLKVRSLTALNSVVKSFMENEMNGGNVSVRFPLIIRATGNDIDVYSSVDETHERKLLFSARPIVPDVILNTFIDPEKMIINVNTCFEQNENTSNFIKNISKLYKVSTVESVDNGIGAQLKVTQGVNLGDDNNAVVIDPIVALTPIATYQEIKQVQRKFNLRVNDNGKVDLMVCDEGYFERQIQDELGDYFSEAFKEEIEFGQIILAM